MVCLRNICINTLHRRDDDDDMMMMMMMMMMIIIIIIIINQRNSTIYKDRYKIIRRFQIAGNGNPHSSPRQMKVGKSRELRIAQPPVQTTGVKYVPATLHCRKGYITPRLGTVRGNT